MMELLTTCFRSDGYCDHEMSIFDDPPGHPALFFSKRPTDAFRIERVFLADPALFVIHVLRDPRSVITSVHRIRPDRYFCNFRVWRECADAARRLDRHPRFLSVRYEELVRSPDSVQQRVVERFPFLERIHGFTEFKSFSRPCPRTLKALGGMREISDDRIAAWIEHLPRIRSELDAHPELLEALVEYGYEEDSSWTSILDGVRPEKHRCRYPDRRPLLKRIGERLRIWSRSQRYIARRRFGGRRASVASASRYGSSRGGRAE